ncbi:MAG: tetratricopeptide repeat protein [Holophagaceae bacterium]|nr:tetratricopeptide repeat protein [Holophagaceae bacterium]
MRNRFRFALTLALPLGLAAQAPVQVPALPPVPSSQAPSAPVLLGTPMDVSPVPHPVLDATVDPLVPPADLVGFARRVTHTAVGNPQKLQALLSAFFRSPEDGGLGITYDNAHTRTLDEVWHDRKANCLGLTSLFVAASRSIGVEVHYAEPLNTSHWRRNGNLVRYERHVVAMAFMPPLEDLVADFLPKLRKREARYIVSLLSEERVRALWAANRAVEVMEAGDIKTAEAFATQALKFDPTCSVGWNTLGVLRGRQGNHSSAEECYRRSLQLDGSDGAAIGNLETLLRGDGRWEEAMAYRRLGLELRRKDPYFQSFLAEEAMAEGRFQEAEKHIKAAIKLQPFDPDLYVLEASVRIALGNGSDAAKSLELARKWASPKERERYDSKLAALKLLGS